MTSGIGQGKKCAIAIRLAQEGCNYRQSIEDVEDTAMAMQKACSYIDDCDVGSITNSKQCFQFIFDAEDS